MNNKYFLERANSALIIIDFQEKLSSKMKYHDSVLKNIQKLIHTFKILNIPIVLTEQYPKGIGPTEEGIRNILPEYKPIVKSAFSCYGEKAFVDEISRMKRQSLILTGIESHVCVLQTALDCLKEGYHVHIISDGVCSREKMNREIAIELMREAGAVISATEIAIFQLLKLSGTEEFKKIMTFIK